MSERVWHGDDNDCVDTTGLVRVQTICDLLYTMLDKGCGISMWQEADSAYTVAVDGVGMFFGDSLGDAVLAAYEGWRESGVESE